MRSIRLAALAAFLLCAGLTSPATAGIIFSDNFNGENGGVANQSTLNYGAFANWSVSGGTVDLIGNGYFDFFPGNGLYVDLDGSTGNAGVMTSNQAFTFDLGTPYILSFLLAGNQRDGNMDTALVRVAAGTLLNVSVSLTPTYPLSLFTFFIIGDGSVGTLSFEGLGSDNIGLLLDDVTLTAVPEPASMLLLGTGLVGLARLRRRR